MRKNPTALHVLRKLQVSENMYKKRDGSWTWFPKDLTSTNNTSPPESQGYQSNAPTEKRAQ
jgi:hypothetical protein